MYDILLTYIDVEWRQGDVILNLLSMLLISCTYKEPKFHSRAESPDANSNLSMSQTIKIEDEESAERDGSTPKDAVIVDEDDIDPKDVWRVAYPYKTYQLFLRPATVSKFNIIFLNISEKRSL